MVLLCCVTRKEIIGDKNENKTNVVGVCIGLTGCGASLHRQNRGVATIAEGGLWADKADQSNLFKTATTKVTVEVPFQLKYQQIDIDKEFSYAKKNLSAELFKKFKQKVETAIEKTYLRWPSQNCRVNDKSSRLEISFGWRSCKVGLASRYSDGGGSAVVYPLFVPIQMLTSAGCGTTEQEFVLELGKLSDLINVRFRQPQRIILKCKRAKCRIEDGNGNLIEKILPIVVQVSKNSQEEQKLVSQLKKEEKERQQQERERKRQEHETERRRMRAIRDHGGKKAYCLSLYSAIQVQQRYITMSRYRFNEVLEDFNVLGCSNIVQQHLIDLELKKAQAEQQRLKSLGYY